MTSCGLVAINILEEPATSMSEILMPMYCTKPWRGMPEECKVHCMDLAVGGVSVTGRHASWAW